MILYDEIDNFIKQNMEKKINNIRIIYGKPVENISDKDGLFFNTQINSKKIDILIPLITSLFSINYEINKKYKLYTLDNVLDITINENGTKCSNVKSTSCINSSLIDNSIFICNKTVDKSLISFSNMRKYYNIEKYISINWEIYNNCYIICNIGKDFITFELEINKINALSKIKKQINDFNKILSHLDVKSDDIN